MDDEGYDDGVEEDEIKNDGPCTFDLLRDKEKLEMRNVKYRTGEFDWD